MEWKVPICIHRALRSPTREATLSFISPAAFRVNVRAMTSLGLQSPSSMCATLQVSTLVLPDPAPAMMSEGPSVQRTASFWALFSPSNRSVCEMFIIVQKYTFFSDIL